MPALNIVIIGTDDTVFDDKLSDTRKRHIAYAREVARLAPGSKLTYLVITKRAVKKIVTGALEVAPVRSSRHLFQELTQRHLAKPISLVSPQDIARRGWVALLFARLARVPAAGQIHHELFSPRAIEDHFGRGWRGRLLHLLSLRALGLYSVVRVDGPRDSAAIRSRGLHRKISVIPVPVTLPPAPSRAKRAPLVLFVGRFAPQKNLELWREVARRVRRAIPNARFRMIGDGEAINEPGIETPGRVAPADLPRHYAEASVFLLTSHYEGFPRVLIEALSQGVPVVATAISGVTEIVEHGRTGFLHPPDAAALAGSVCALLRDSAMRDRMGDAGRAAVGARYGLDTIAPRLGRFLVEGAGA